MQCENDKTQVILITAPEVKKKKQQPPQRAIDKFQAKFNGFVFYRDSEWRLEIIDDKLYLTKPDYDESWIERYFIEDRIRTDFEENYRKFY